MGLGKKTGIDLPGEEMGLIPSEEWKQRVFRQRWYPGETISVSIGQGAVTVTPMQVAYTIGGIVLGGKFAQPHLLKDSEPAPQISFPIAESTVEAVTDGMWGVVNEPGGTAGASRLPGIEFSGKTGTAQTISLQGRQRAGQKAEFKDNAWFVGFAPRRNAEIVVAVLVQSGEHGSSAAAPIARDIVKVYYDKKNGIKPGVLMTKGPSATAVPGVVAAREGQPIELAPAEEQVPVATDR
jgi:penicillin-binding protein 2